MQSRSVTAILEEIADVKAKVLDMVEKIDALLAKPGGAAGAPVARTSLTIKEFCERNHLSEGQYHKLRRVGKGPRTMKAGKSRGVRISIEAEREWIAERETDDA